MGREIDDLVRENKRIKEWEVGGDFTLPLHLIDGLALGLSPFSLNFSFLIFIGLDRIEGGSRMRSSRGLLRLHFHI